MDLGLTGKVALVTGGSEGIGKAAALSLVAEGAKATICARREDVLNGAADEIRAAT
ncbi:MAG: SDR family NAD(P)-dependent oxidoreductase, partial [Dehalococcoidia bacterium]|nr:SDR family NAD(P)-dependent oxidoreductase [Dehalococcoidia bacterium]